MIPEALRERIERFRREAVEIVPYDPRWPRLFVEERDRLKELFPIAHQDVAREYLELKQQLADEFPHDRSAYTEGKGEFIRSVTERARRSVGS